MRSVTERVCWPVRSDDVEACVARAVSAAPRQARVSSRRQYRGRAVNAVTLTASHIGGAKPALLVTQPHAHEPATTVGILHVLHELTLGFDLDGRPTQLDVERILHTCDITFVPNGNPEGRDRATCLVLDGSTIDNDALRRQMRGVDPRTGEAWVRLDHWSLDQIEHPPDPIGIVYEQLDSKTWCEPNRCVGSTLMRLCRDLSSHYDYHVWIDLHQTQMEHEEANCFVLMPVLQDELPPARQAANDNLATLIHDTWERSPFGRPRRIPSPFPYSGDQARYFRSVWGPIQKRMVQLNVEVQMNSSKTTLSQQADLEADAIRATLRFICDTVTRGSHW